jgi:hypothetical protein
MFDRLTKQVDLAALTHIVAARNRPAVLGGNSAVPRRKLFAAEPLKTFTFCLHETDPFDKLAHVWAAIGSTTPPP